MKKWPWFLLSLLIILLDYYSKRWAIECLMPYSSNYQLPIFNFTLAFNKGTAFSLLSHLGGWQRWFLASFSALMSLFIITWIVRLHRSETLQLAALSLILGGALGNLYDRLMFGQVIDFIDVHYHGYHWPIFNLADSAISIGVLLFLFDLIRSSSRH